MTTVEHAKCALLFGRAYHPADQEEDEEMDRTIVERLSAANSDRILRRLTAHQHLHPTSTVVAAIGRVCREEGLDLTPEGVAHPFRPENSIGRLSRTQICQLAEQIESTWQAKLAQRFEARSNR